MKSIRIYKDDIRTHVLRSLFFTDTAIVVIGITVIALGLYGGFRVSLGHINWSYYLSSLFVLTVFFVAVITQKIDNQPIYKITPRAITFKRRPKQLRTKDIDQYFTDFVIQDNHLIRKHSVVRIFEVQPHDIALLNDQDREHFFTKLKQVIHTLPAPIQIIVRKEPATLEDYSPHIFSLYKTSKTSTESILKSYTEDLTALIESNNFMITRYYLILSVSAQTSNPYKKLEAIKKLHDYGTRIASALNFCHVHMQPLDNARLVTLSKQILR